MAKRATGVADSNGIEIAYETFGTNEASAILLVMGLGAQMISWPDEICDKLAADHLVVRFDNRDIGLSSHLDMLAAPPVTSIFLGRQKAPYTIGDMANDAAGLLDELGLEQVHVAGVSMGGFIAQSLAILHPERVRSLCLVMTSSGARFVGAPKPQVALRLARRRPATSREQAVASAVETFKLIGSPGFPFDEERTADLAGRSYDRAYDPAGVQRQMAAIGAQPDRTTLLRRVRVPTVVIHGLSDPLVAVSGGRALARAIPGARFVAVPGMGHDLPRAVWPRFVEEVEKVAARAESPSFPARSGRAPA